MVLVYIQYKYKASTRLTSHRCGEFIDNGERPFAAGSIGKTDTVGALDEATVETKRLRLVKTVDACHIPHLAMATGEDNTLSRIAAQIARLIPYVWQQRQEILNSMWLGEKTLGFIGEMLQTTLKESWASEVIWGCCESLKAQGV